MKGDLVRDDLVTWLLVAAYRDLSTTWDPNHAYRHEHSARRSDDVDDCPACLVDRYILWARSNLPAYWSNAWTNPLRAL